MALSRFILPYADVGSGIKPPSGAQLFFYETGTSQLKDTFTDPEGTIPNTNPVIADATGLFGDIFITGTYKVVLRSKPTPPALEGSQIWEADPVTSTSANELSVIARALNVEDGQVIYSTDTTTVLDDVLYIYDAGVQTTWGVPELDSTGKTIFEVVDDILTTVGGAGGNTYTLIPLSTAKNYESTLTMRQSTALTAGDVATTNSYYGGWAAVMAPPKGGSTYDIVTLADFGAAPNEWLDISIDDGVHVAVLRKGRDVFLEQCGAVGGDGTANDYDAIAAALSSLTEVYLTPKSLYGTDQQITVPNRRRIYGAGEESGFSWIGATPATAPDKTGGTAVLLVASDSTGSTALSDVFLGAFKINLNSTPNMIGLSWIYGTVQSRAEHIKIVGMVGASFGFYFSKTWYASFSTLSVRTDSQLSGSVGLYLSSYHNQINGVDFHNIQVNGAETGVVLNTEDTYHYKNTMTGLIEGCEIGIKHIGGLGVRNALFNLYFESNSILDIDWGTAITPLDLTGDITWLSCSFNPTQSNIYIAEGTHRFQGCNIIQTMTMDGGSVWVDGNAAMVKTINAGRIEHIGNITWHPTKQLDASLYIAYKGGRSAKKTMSGGATALAVFPIPADTIDTIPSEGLVVKVMITTRRTYAAVEYFWEGYLSANSAGAWSIKATVATATIGGIWSVAVDSVSGDISVENNNSDTKLTTISWEPI